MERRGGRRDWCDLTHRLLITVLVSLVTCVMASPFLATPAFGASSTSFNPTSVNLAVGQSATITIVAAGLQPGDTAAQFGVVHNPANTMVTSPQCVGIFAGASPNQAAQANGDLLACTFGTGMANGPTGNVMLFVLTNMGGAAETITFNAATTFYITGTTSQELPGALNALTVTTCILGDINCDGIVDIRDYGIWRQNFGQTNCGNPADLNGDCIVDIRDYGIWRANFGHTAGAAARTATPVAAPPLGTATPAPTPPPRPSSAKPERVAELWPFGSARRVR